MLKMQLDKMQLVENFEIKIKLREMDKSKYEW